MMPACDGSHGTDLMRDPQRRLGSASDSLSIACRRMLCRRQIRGPPCAVTSTPAPSEHSGLPWTINATPRSPTRSVAAAIACSCPFRTAAASGLDQPDVSRSGRSTTMDVLTVLRVGLSVTGRPGCCGVEPLWQAVRSTSSPRRPSPTPARPTWASVTRVPLLIIDDLGMRKLPHTAPPRTCSS